VSPSQFSMVVDPIGSGYGITHHIVGSDVKQITMTLQTPLDGNETPFLIGGKPRWRGQAAFFIQKLAM